MTTIKDIVYGVVAYGQGLMTDAVHKFQTVKCAIMTDADYDTCSTPDHIKIGQMVILGFEGKETADEGVKEAMRYAAGAELGGFILSSGNIENPEQVKKLTAALRSAEMPKFPLLLAIDEEGGRVQRLSPKKGFGNYPGPASVASMSPLEVSQAYSALAAEVYRAGINVNFGPVVDVAVDPAAYIAKAGRTFSEDPRTVGSLAEQFVSAHRLFGIATTLKHFPGLGSARSDSHLGFTDVSGTWSSIEIEPYEALIAKGMVDLVMSAHVFCSHIDDRLPASLSKKWLDGILRTELGFKGLVITDDLQMGAIKNNYSVEDTVVMAINAGNDILLFTNLFRHDTPESIIGIVRKAIQSGRVTEERINTSFMRIRKFKQFIARPPAARKSP